MTEQMWEDFCAMLAHLNRVVEYRANGIVVVHCAGDKNMEALADVVEQITTTHGHDVDVLVVIRTVILEDHAILWCKGTMR